jgi:hypothetical protein
LFYLLIEDIPEDQTKHTENNLRSETLHEIDDMKETMKTVMSGIQHPMSVDDPNESKTDISKISIFDDLFNIFEMESRLLFGSLSLIDLDILSFIFLRNEDKDGFC